MPAEINHKHKFTLGPWLTAIVVAFFAGYFTCLWQYAPEEPPEPTPAVHTIPLD